MPALFIGRFQPFHKGHLAAIKWILKKERNIFIIIGSNQIFPTKENPFHFKERKEMIERTLLKEGIKNFKIFGVHDYNNDELWAKKVLKATKTKPDTTLVFTCNPWTKRCFKKVGVEVRTHPLFFNKLSATKIRRKITVNKNWKNLVPKTVYDFLKKIDGEERIKKLSVLPEKKIINFIKEKVKEAGARGGIVGISGGIDSSVTAVLTKKALGNKAVFLHTPFIKNYSFQKNTFLLEKKIKIKVKRIYLGEAYKDFLRILPEGNRLTTGNLKPRLRMVVLYYLANLYNLLVIGTGNKSELEIGYFTKYGDGGVDILPLGDLYKTEVIEMAKRLGLSKEIIEAVPAADLWMGQTDEKEIGIDYQKLDAFLKISKRDLSKKETSFLINIPRNKIKSVLEMKRKNAHKLSLPPICLFKI